MHDFKKVIFHHILPYILIYNQY